MRAAAAALWRVLVGAAAAGTLADTIRDGVALATWALDHPTQFSAVVHLARGIGFAADLTPDPEEAAALVEAREAAALDKHGAPGRHLPRYRRPQGLHALSGSVDWPDLNVLWSRVIFACRDMSRVGRVSQEDAR